MRFTSVTPDDIIFNDYNNRAIKVEPIQFQIPRMYMPFGVSGFTPNFGAVKWNVDFSMKGFDENDQGRILLQFLKPEYEVTKLLELFALEDADIDEVLQGLPLAKRKVLKALIKQDR